jgi:hypothetical protein
VKALLILTDSHPDVTDVLFLRGRHKDIAILAEFANEKLIEEVLPKLQEINDLGIMKICLEHFIRIDQKNSADLNKILEELNSSPSLDAIKKKVLALYPTTSHTKFLVDEIIKKGKCKDEKKDHITTPVSTTAVVCQNIKIKPSQIEKVEESLPPPTHVEIFSTQSSTTEDVTSSKPKISPT